MIAYLTTHFPHYTAVLLGWVFSMFICGLLVWILYTCRSYLFHMFRHNNCFLDGNVLQTMEMEDAYTKNSRTRHTKKGRYIYTREINSFPKNILFFVNFLQVPDTASLVFLLMFDEWFDHEPCMRHHHRTRLVVYEIHLLQGSKIFPMPQLTSPNIENSFNIYIF